jgi:hypothetical protein
VGELIALEARLMLRDPATVRKRWVRLVGQGATVAAFDPWEPMRFETTRTVKFGTAR